MKKALVISGGGAKGAWGGGAAQSLFENHNKEWDIFLGCSTGSLLVTMVPSESFQILKDMYTSVNTDNIFSVNPYTKKGKYNFWNILKRVIGKKTSLGEFGGLRHILLKDFTQNEFDFLKTIKKDVYVTVVNMTKGKVEFFSNNELTYHEFINMVIASTSVPIAADLVKHNGDMYLDGGLMEHIPIKKAIDLGADEIDVIVHRPEKFENDDWKADNMFDVLTRTIDLMQREVSLSDVMIAQLAAQIDREVKINFYYTPYKLCENSLLFDKDTMLRWWDEGYEYIKDQGCQKCYVINKNKQVKRLK